MLVGGRLEKYEGREISIVGLLGVYEKNLENKTYTSCSGCHVLSLTG